MTHQQTHALKHRHPCACKHTPTHGHTHPHSYTHTHTHTHTHSASPRSQVQASMLRFRAPMAWWIKEAAASHGSADSIEMKRKVGLD